MKKILFALVFMAFVGSSFAQLNMSLQSQLTYNTDLNDIWGWKDEVSGIEYALVGLRTGVSIVSLEDPTNAVEVQFIPGASSTWRDLKTWGNFLYVSNETGDGLMVIDLSDLPNSAPAYNWQPDLPELGGVLDQIHNLYVDEGMLYITGSNLNNGGNLIVDVDTDPGNPIFVAAAPAIYAHDVYVRDNIMYSSEIYAGTMTIYDISDVNDIQLLGSQVTPFEFTHNIWLSDDSSVAFTTDERANAPVAAYDISDFGNIVELDQYAPIETLGDGVIPHNVHVWNDWLVISYYTDGGIIVDASRPENLIEVGNFDTFFGAGAGFSGAWGLYPFLPSGLVLVSSIGDGLFVLDADYVRACWLEGKVTDAVTGAELNDVSVHIDSEQANLASTDGSGNYETGQAIPGSFEVTYEKTGYQSKTITTTLDNGVVTIEDVELQPEATYSISGNVVNAVSGEPVANANISLDGNSDYVINSDENGTFTISVLSGDYEIYAGAWGYEVVYISGQTIDGDNNLTIELIEANGYVDDFAVDLGWISSSDANATTGFWVRGEPVGTTTQGNFSNPEFDLTNDIGDQAYVTGNAGGGVGDDDVDDGIVTLTSPVMDLSGQADATVSYNLWFFNAGGNNAPNDQLQVRVSNGTEEVVLETITESQSDWRPVSTFTLADKIALTDNMTVIFETGDEGDTGNLVEGAVDGFSVSFTPSSIKTIAADELAFTAYPNPFSQNLTLSFDLSTFENGAQLNVYNALGQLVQQTSLSNSQTSIELGNTLNKGVYFVEILSDNKVSQSLRIVKQ